MRTVSCIYLARVARAALAVSVVMTFGVAAQPRVASAQTAKFDRAVDVFVSVWRQTFTSFGKTFPAPKLVAFKGTLTGTGCGTITPDNAYYCPPDNTIYYDVEFLAAQSRDVGQMTGTDGDYAPIAAVAHELGHAVSAHLQRSANLRQRLSYRVNGHREEMLADCLSGAVTRGAAAAGLLDRTDLGEGLMLMRMIGTPFQPFPTNPGVKNWLQRHAESHPAPEDRQRMFQRGYDRGAAGCGEVANLLSAPLTGY